MVSRQRLWQIKQQSEGKCIICSKPAVNRTFCAFHRLQNILKRREERKQRKIAGICQRCNQPVSLSNSFFCPKHQEDNNRKRRKKHE